MSQNSALSVNSDERKLVARFIEMHAQERDNSRSSLEDDYPDDHEAMPDEPDWPEYDEDNYVPQTPQENKGDTQDTEDTGDHKNGNLSYGPLRRHDAIIVPGTSDREAGRRINFRMTAKKWLLTYSQADGLTKQAVIMELLKKGPAKEWMVSQEWHEDEGIHFHVYIHYTHKLNVKRADFFDIVTDAKRYHPNVQTVKNDKAAKRYVCKYGNVITSLQNTFDWSTDRNFVKRFADNQAYNAALVFNGLDEVRWPIRMPDGTNQHKPALDERKRHYWICGPANTGKTRWAQVTFRGQKVFFPAQGNGYPFEGYKGEEVVVFDDWKLDDITKEMLVNIANVYTTPGRHHVFGKTRYTPVFWPANQARIIIILSNGWPLFENDDWFTTRFYPITVVDALDIEDSDFV